MTSSLYSNWGKGLKQVANSILNIFLLQAESIETQVVLNLQKEASIMKRWQAQDRSRGNKHRKISQFYCVWILKKEHVETTNILSMFPNL